MGMVFDEVTFDGRAPTIAQMVTKITELSGLPVIFQEPSDDIEGLHDQHAFLAFACVPQEQLEVFSYNPGAAKKFYNDFMEGFEDLPTAKHATGLNEAAGTQVVYLRAYVGQELTLMTVAMIALEALGGRPKEPISDEDRREFGGPVTEAQLMECRRALDKKFKWATVLWVLLLPISIPVFLLSLGASLLLIPVRIWLAWRAYGDFTEKRSHKDLLSAMPDRLDFVQTSTDAYPDLDTSALQHYTQTLESLGFVQAIDFEVRANVAFAGRGFGRLFFHRQHRCIAEVSQVFPHYAEPGLMRVMIGSCLADDWDLSTTDREPEATTWAWRRPRSLWSSHPGLSPEDLLAEHLRRRERMIEVLKVAVTTELTLDFYYAHERKAQADRKTVLQVKSMAVIQEEMRAFEKSPRHRWAGDLADRLRSEVEPRENVRSQAERGNE